METGIGAAIVALAVCSPVIYAVFEAIFGK